MVCGGCIGRPVAGEGGVDGLDTGSVCSLVARVLVCVRVDVDVCVFVCVYASVDVRACWCVWVRVGACQYVPVHVLGRCSLVHRVMLAIPLLLHRGRSSPPPLRLERPSALAAGQPVLTTAAAFSDMPNTHSTTAPTVQGNISYPIRGLPSPGNLTTAAVPLRSCGPAVADAPGRLPP